MKCSFGLFLQITQSSQKPNVMSMRTRLSFHFHFGKGREKYNFKKIIVTVWWCDNFHGINKNEAQVWVIWDWIHICVLKQNTFWTGFCVKKLCHQKDLKNDWKMHSSKFLGLSWRLSDQMLFGCAMLCCTLAASLPPPVVLFILRSLSCLGGLREVWRVSHWRLSALTTAALLIC